MPRSRRPGSASSAATRSCLDMGRDRFEAARGHPLGGPESDTDAGGGLAAEGARWVAEHGVSMLVWDMLDSCEAKLTHASAHVLTWAIGLLLVDNCDFVALRGPRRRRHAGRRGDRGRTARGRGGQRRQPQPARSCADPIVSVDQIRFDIVTGGEPTGRTTAVTLNPSPKRRRSTIALPRRTSTRTSTSTIAASARRSRCIGARRSRPGS